MVLSSGATDPEIWLDKLAKFPFGTREPEEEDSMTNVTVSQQKAKQRAPS